MNSLIRPAAVAKRTRCPWRQAARPRETARWAGTAMCLGLEGSGSSKFSFTSVYG